MKIALYQMKMSNNIAENHQKTLASIKSAAENHADLILFPEIQYCPFFPQHRNLDVSSFTMSLDHPYVQDIQELCRKLRIMAAPNIYLLENNKTYDATILINHDGTILGLQKMVHVAQAEGFYEQDYYTPSEDGFHVFQTEYGNLGIVVCYDRHYPESIRTEALMDADLILIPTANTTDEPSDLFEWELRVQAFQSSVAIAMCNRVGLEDQMNFSGESLIVGPDGSVIDKLDQSEQLYYADIDLSKIQPYRDSKTYTQLRRTDLYK